MSKDKKSIEDNITTNAMREKNKDGAEPSKMKNFWEKASQNVLVCFLLTFMLLIFSPAETFFANSAELPFIYWEFGQYMAILAIGMAVIMGVIISFLPEMISRGLLGVVFGISIGAYIQNMFMNKGLDLMGYNPEGYKAESSVMIVNLIIWIVILIVVVTLTFICKNNKLTVMGAAFLLAIQLLALVSLYIKADENAYCYPLSEYHLDGEEQFKVSSKGNVILLILDYFSNQDLQAALAQKPDALEVFTDFTYYNNTDSVYCGTYPSITHMITNSNVNFEVGVNDWTKEAWMGEKSNYFYQSMHEAGYKCNLYTPDLNLLCGTNDREELLGGRIDNFTNAPQTRIVANKKVIKVMSRMAAYRMSPTVLKNNFYVNLNEYYDTVAIDENPIAHENYDFHARLINEGLTIDNSTKYFFINHLMGTHLFNNNANGEYMENSNVEETALGCLKIVDEYLSELKRLGVYDDATIIVTADHGHEYGQQPIFFIKNPGDSNEEMNVNSAPISFDDLLPTIAEAAGVDPGPIGETIYAYHEGDMRERTLYIMDDDEAYPTVKSYYEDKVGLKNVYKGFTYTGDEEELQKYLFGYPSKIIPMVDSFF